MRADTVAMPFAPKLVAILIVTAACACRPLPQAQNSEVKIVGGVEVMEGDQLLRYTAAMTKPDGRFFCSAVLIHPRMLVTAAHCMKPGNMQGGVRVVFGRKAKTGTSFDVVRHETHHEYVPVGSAGDKAPNDIGVLFLATDVPGTIGTPVPFLDDGTTIEPFRTEVTIAGYGMTRTGAGDSGTLRSAITFASTLPTESKELFLDSLGIRNACQGDSGGPAVILRRASQTLVPLLVGVASYVIETTMDKCESGLSAYTDVRAHRSWLQSKIP